MPHVFMCQKHPSALPRRTLRLRGELLMLLSIRLLLAHLFTVFNELIPIPH